MKTIIALLGIALLIAACSTAPTGHATGDEPIRIGASLPLTGEAASFGDAGRAAIELYVEKLNANGGINGRPVEIVYEDDTCSGKSLQAFQRLVSFDDVTAIVGPICSAAAGPALPMVQEAGIPTIMIASAPHLTSIGDYMFRVYPSDAFVGKFIAKQLINDGITSVAVVNTNNDWGVGVRNSFVESYKAIGGEVVVDEAMNPDDQDARTIVEKIKKSTAQAIITPTYPKNLLALLRNVKESGLDVPIVTGDAGDADEVLSNELSEGMYYVTASFDFPEEMKQRIKAKIGNEGNLAAPYYYDAILVATEAIKEAGTDKAAIREALSQGKWKGTATNSISFDSNGDLEAAKYDIQQIRQGESEIVSSIE